MIDKTMLVTYYRLRESKIKCLSKANLLNLLCGGTTYVHYKFNLYISSKMIRVHKWQNQKDDYGDKMSGLSTFSFSYSDIILSSHIFVKTIVKLA